MIPMTPENLLRQLAEHHEQHLRWLSRRLGSTVSPHEIEDVLQGAYTRALAALRRPQDTSSFEDLGRAGAWLRTIALHLALDIERQRRGRPGDGRERRLDPASLDAEGLPSLADARVHLEDDVLESLERDARRLLIADAIGALDPKHQQILQLRYGRDLDPATIMVLEGLSRGQWEGRHTRAVNALGRALARLQVSSECGRTRRLLRRSPADLLGGSQGPASDHVATCVACGAFARSAQYALATLPLPLAIAAWRYDAAECLVRPASRHGSDPGAGGPGPRQSGAARAAAGKLAALATAGAMGVCALAAGERIGALASDAGAGSPPPMRATPETALSLAAHETPAQALARSAREMARRRAKARRAAAGSAMPSAGSPIAVSSAAEPDGAPSTRDDRQSTRGER